jgi:glycosyltransferase involved in cell wall biosynthesis
MKVSIITACYNSANTIIDCISTVNNQTYQNIEHIIIDGGSTDGTVEYLKQSKLVNQIISERDHGIYDALNKGIQIATGDVIGFLHSDDMLASSDIITKIVALFQKTKADGVYGNLVFVNAENKIVRTWIRNPFKRENVKYGWMPPHPTLFLRKEVYTKHGLFDISFKTAGDYDFMLRVMLDKKINLVYLPEVITKMRMGGVSTGNVKQLLLKSKEDIRALRKNGFLFPLLIVGIKIGRKLPQLLKR